MVLRRSPPPSSVILLGAHASPCGPGVIKEYSALTRLALRAALPGVIKDYSIGINDVHNVRSYPKSLA